LISNRLKHTAVLAFLALTTVSCFPTEPALEPFARLSGQWIANGDDGKILEQWYAGSENRILEGGSFQINGTDSILTERLTIAATDSGIYYIAAVKGQNNNQPVAFRMMPSENGQLIFENPDHDFPKKLMYTFSGDDSLTVNVYGDSLSFTINFIRY
jgi:Domain of unknown function (DUF6265)